MRARFDRHVVLRLRFGAAALSAALMVGAVGSGTSIWSVAARADTPTTDAAATPTPLFNSTDSASESRSLSGSYLAGRLAKGQFDNASAASFYRRALARDPGNSVLLEQAFLMEASEGNWTDAIEHGRQIIAAEPQNRMAQLMVGLTEFKSGAYKKAGEHFKAASSGPIGELTSALAMSWARLAEGDQTGALASLDQPKQPEWAQFYLRYHKALISDLAGRRAEARSSYDRVFKQDSRTLRTALAFARHAAQAGDVKLARAVLKDHLDRSQGDSHPLARDLMDRIDAKERIALLVATPTQGLAEVFYGLGEALTGEGGVNVGVLYLQMALYLEPDHAFALAALANAHETTKNYDAALAVYDRIDKSSPLQSAIEIRKAFNLNSLEKVDAARDTLLKLLASTPKAADSAPATATPTAAPSDPTPQTAAAPPADIGPLPTDARPLRLGMADDRVKRLQDALTAQGYDVGGADGIFGDGTRKAVIAFQKSRTMDADGLVGPATYRAVLGAPAVATEPAAAKPAAGSTPKPAVVKDVQTELEVLDALGNIMRAHKKYGEAVGYYDRAIVLIGKPDKRHWGYFYARGTCNERLKNWPAAEADLQRALTLMPDQPLVLNYLGYSWIDQGRNLKQGMALIEKAVALKPDDGYIVDSLGWAHFKQGNYKEAVRYLERAVELKPDDPVLNDHLGDALWRVGREREARFQWDQSLSLKPEPEDIERIKKKINSGLEPPAQAAPEKKTNKEAAVPRQVTRAQPTVD
ncbi:MAG: tetratricopeptide repeat protein [Hyphomicrobium sp.]